MKSIEETHPSLKGELFTLDEARKMNMLEGNKLLIWALQMQKHTVDKSSLKKFIIQNKYFFGTRTTKRFINKLIMAFDLGLPVEEIE